MEEKILSLDLDDQQIKYLVAQSVMKNYPELMKLSADLENLLIEKNDNFENLKLQTIKLEMENEARKILSFYISSESLINENKVSPRKQVRIYMDGVFDIIHSGHFNAIRQSKKLGDILVVGVNSDSDVEKSKGPTLMNVKERSALVRACKWVDEVLEDTPYTPTVKFLEEIGVDYCAHGDDMPINEHGVGCYDEIKNAGMLKVFKRTEGISTTEIIGRLLRGSPPKKKSSESRPITSTDLFKKVGDNENNFQMAPIMSNFLSTSWRIAEFCNNRTPKDTDKIVYIDGSFDILHIGHIETLRKAKELGDFLYVGVHDDTTVTKYRGKNYPILNLQERTFNLLALKYVDEVVIGAPWFLTEDLIKSLKINLVVQGTNNKYDEDYYNLSVNQEDPYSVPKNLGVYHEIESCYDLTNELLIKRIVEKRDIYMKKYQNKSVKETEYYQNKKDVINEI